MSTSQISNKKASTELALQALSTQKTKLVGSIEELKKYPGDPKKIGKCRLPIAVFEKRCLDRISSLEQQMDAHPKSSPMWQKLRKRKLA